MRLPNYPTPRTDQFYRSFADGTAKPSQAEWLYTMQNFEREAAAWRDVATMLDRASKLEELQKAHEAFDKLKSELEQP
jgi:hypothetical protein